MMWLKIALACAALAFADGAHAQVFRVLGPEGVQLTVQPAPDATLESLTAQLSDALVNFDNSGIEVREGMVREGEIIATRVVPYTEVARLTNDVTRAGAISGRVLLLPAATPLYAHRFVNSDALIANGRTRAQRLWCGAHEGRGYCLIQRRNGWESAQIHSGSPYTPATLGPFVPASAPVIVNDPTALTELPVRTEVYRLKSMGGARAVVARYVRANGDEAEVGDVRPRRMRLGSLMVQIEPGPEAASATVSAAPLDPAAYRSELRSSARDILYRLR